MKKQIIFLIFILLNLIGKSYAQGTYNMCVTPTITDTTGTLYDSGGPNGIYNVNENCTTLIAPTQQSIITLTFSKFQTEINYDYLYIYDGTSTSDPLILMASGAMIPAAVTATSGSMLLVWRSDVIIVDSGFACTWTAFQCPCGTITGNVYNDINSNCVFDTGEGVVNIPVYITDSVGLNTWRNTDTNGYYSFMLPVGASTFINVNSGSSYNTRYSPTCPASGSISATAPSSGNDFGMECLPGYDMTGYLNAWAIRPGVVSYFCAFINNKRCVTPSGQVVMNFDSGLVPLIDTMGTGYTVSGQTVTFPINAPSLNWTFCIPVAISPSITVNDTVCVEMIIQPVSGDADTLDNQQVFCFPIVNSFDPNKKSVSPEGVGASGSVLPNTPLTYTIQFQNTGNADAINVVVEDTLSMNLDISTLQIIASSHPMQWSCDGRILKFTYNNIMLADSVTNEPASHGYVVFKISPYSNSANLSQITNMAAIYFDFNPPILTNVTLNTIDFFLSDNRNEVAVKPVLFPNPANGLCFIRFNDNSYRDISLFNISGQLMNYYHTFSKDVTFETQSLSAGLYFVKIREANGITKIVKMSVVH